MMIQQRTGKPKVFFAHSKQFYDSPQEERILYFLRKNHKVICPNNDIGGIEAFGRYLNIINWADAVVVLEFEGFLTMDIYHAVVFAIGQNIPVWCVREASDGCVFFLVRKAVYAASGNPDHYGKLTLFENDSPIQ